MSGGLARKELRDLRPFVLLGALLVVMDLAYWLTAQFDVQPLGASFVEQAELLAAALFFVSFALGTGLLTREIDDRTLGFLDGLPVSRLRVAGTKVATAWGVLLVYPVGSLLVLLLQHAAARQSLDHAMHPALLWQLLVLICVVMGTGLALGMLLGFLRSLTWLTLALGVIVLHGLTQAWAGFSVLNPVKLVDVQLVGAQWRWPMTGLVIQISVLIVSALAALAIFITSGGTRGSKLQAGLNRPLVSAMVALATIGAAFGATAVYFGGSPDPVAPDPDEPQYAGATFEPSPPGSALTRYYSFSYPARQGSNVQALLDDADRIYAEVADLLGVEPGARIDVDLSGSATNTAGTAFHERIRMHNGLAALATLAHETAHVLANRLAGGEQQRELAKMRVFNEGLAEWIENRVTTGTGLTDQSRLQAAIVSRRQLLRAEHLTDFELLEREADLTLQYPLGAALVDSMVTRYGREAPARLLRTLGDPDFPRDLQKAELWFAAFQGSGFDLGLVFADYSRRLKSWELEFAGQINALPRPRGSLVRDGNMIGVELRLDTGLPEGWSALMRARPRQDSPLTDYWTSFADEDLVAWIPAYQAIDGQLCFQPGVRSFGAAIFESWVCLSLDSAAEWQEPSRR